MRDPLVEQFDKAFGLESKKKVARKSFSRRMRQYKIYKEIFGEKRTQKLIINAISENKL